MGGYAVVAARVCMPEECVATCYTNTTMSLMLPHTPETAEPIDECAAVAARIQFLEILDLCFGIAAVGNLESMQL